MFYVLSELWFHRHIYSWCFSITGFFSWRGGLNILFTSSFFFAGCFHAERCEDDDTTTGREGGEGGRRGAQGEADAAPRHLEGVLVRVLGALIKAGPSAGRMEVCAAVAKASRPEVKVEGTCYGIVCLSQCLSVCMRVPFSLSPLSVCMRVPFSLPPYAFLPVSM